MKPENRQKLLLIAAIAGIALLAGDYLVLTPLQSAWKKRAQRITEVERRLADAKTLLAREDSLKTRWAIMVTNTLPGDFSVAEQKLLQAFDGWSRDSKISLTSLNPQWRGDSDEYMTLQCRVEAAGDLGTITSFLHSIEKDPMAIRIDSLELAARDANGSQIAMTMQVSGLVLPSAQDTSREKQANR